jgi:hypothetical protein
LGKGGLDFGIEGVFGHDDDDGHVFVDESERTVFEFTGEDAFGVHVADFFDLERTFEAGCES